MDIGSIEDSISRYQKMIQCIPHHLYGSEKIYLTRKIPDEPVDSYLKWFKSEKKTTELEGGDILSNHDFIKPDSKKVNIISLMDR